MSRESKIGIYRSLTVAGLIVALWADRHGIGWPVFLGMFLAGWNSAYVWMMEMQER
jgi:ribulose 1,5-bisphosphate synthetase/thiazole synthase